MYCEQATMRQWRSKSQGRAQAMRHFALENTTDDGHLIAGETRQRAGGEAEEGLLLANSEEEGLHDIYIEWLRKHAASRACRARRSDGARHVFFLGRVLSLSAVSSET